MWNLFYLLGPPFIHFIKLHFGKLSPNWVSCSDPIHNHPSNFTWLGLPIIIIYNHLVRYHVHLQSPGWVSLSSHCQLLLHQGRRRLLPCCLIRHRLQNVNRSFNWKQLMVGQQRPGSKRLSLISSSKKNLTVASNPLQILCLSNISTFSAAFFFFFAAFGLAEVFSNFYKETSLVIMISDSLW